MTVTVADTFTFAGEQERSANLADGLRRLADVVSDVEELREKVADLREEATHVEEGRFTIVVLGAFNRGKSTLLNAMIGREVLPMAAVPSTAIITLLRYQQSEQITVHFKDGTRSGPLGVREFKEKYVLPVVEEIEARVAAAGDDGEVDEEERERRRLEAARDIFSPIDYAEVGFPCELCRQGVEFVDSPGFEDDEARTERARDFLEKSDAVLFLLDATQPVTDHDARTLEWIVSRGKRAIFFVINKWNFLEIMERTPAGRQKVEQRFRGKLARYVDGADGYDGRVFKVNALGAFDARKAKPVDEEGLGRSNMPPFERTLERFLVEGRVEARDNALLSKARNFCEEVDQAAARRLRLRQRGLAELIAAKEALEPKLEQLRGVRRHIEEFVDGHMVRVQKMLAESLGAHVAGLDVHGVVYDRLDLSVITDTWLAWAGLIDAGRRVAEWVGLLKKDQTRRFEAKVRASLEPQVRKVIEEEVRKWQASTATLQMKDEGQKLVAYLKEEAADYQRILTEIGEIFQEKDQEQVNVEKVVGEWLKTTVARGGIRPPQLDATGLAIDLTPMIAAIAVDIAMHVKGLAVPVVGTVLAVVLQLWRQARTVDKIKRGIEDGLRQSLGNVPSAEQRHQIDEEVAKNFKALKETVLTNINAHIASIQLSLDGAIADVEKGQFDAEAERRKLDEVRRAAREELAALERACEC